MEPVTWRWDETLYAGSAPHYTVGRMPYPPELAERVAAELGLDGTGRLLDVGCGPGSLTLLLAPWFAAAVGVDADAEMIAEARRRDAEVSVGTGAGAGAGVGAGAIEWRRLRAEELPAGLGTFRVVSFAQSYHWMDQPRVARRVREMIEPGGAWVHVRADTHRGMAGDDPLPHPRPPWDRIAELVTDYLGPVRRAGRGFLPGGTRSGEEEVMRRAGYAGPTRLAVDGGQIAERDLDEIVAAVFSLSSSTPRLFGDRLAAFEADLRRLLRDASPAGWFAERRQATEAVIWRP